MMINAIQCNALCKLSSCWWKLTILSDIAGFLDSNEIFFSRGKVIVGVKQLSPLAERQGSEVSDAGAASQ